MNLEQIKNLEVLSVSFIGALMMWAGNGMQIGLRYLLVVVFLTIILFCFVKLSLWFIIGFIKLVEKGVTNGKEEI